MGNPTFIKTYTADGAIAAHRLCTFGAADGEAAQAAGGTTALRGVNGELAKADSERADVVLSGLADVEYGGNVAAGDPITSDSLGRAIKAVPAAGAQLQCIGYAQVAGAVGEIGLVSVSPFPLMGEDPETLVFTANDAILASRLVGLVSDAASEVVQASASTDPLIGVALAAADAEEEVSVQVRGLASVTLGGTVAPGEPVTADADGKAVKADPAQGVNARIAGFCHTGGDAGETGIVFLAPGQIQGA